MTTTTTRPKPPARVPCTVEDCAYTAEPGSSIAGHVAMAHPDVPMAAVAPKRSARNDPEQRRVVCRGGHPGWRNYICIACGKDVRGTVPGAYRDAGDGGGPSTENVPAEPVDSPPAGAATLLELPLDLVDVGANVRVDVAELEELAASIAEHGVLQPIKATGPHADGRYLVVWGQRRVLASRQAGRTTIAALVVAPAADVDDTGATRSVEQLVENLHRADLNPIDRARAMRDVVDSGVSQADLARKLGIAPSTVANDLRLLGLDDTVVEQLRAGEITASHGKAIASLPPRHQRELASRIRSSHLSAHQIESELQWRRQAAEGDEAKAERTTKQIPKLLAALEAAVPKDVQVHLSGPYNMDADELKKAVKKAGWTLSEGYAQERPAKGECDCAVVRVEFNRAWKVEPGCVDHRHRDRQRNLDQQDHEAERQEVEARHRRIAEYVALDLANVNLPTLRVIAFTLTRAAGYWAGRDNVVTADRDALAGLIDERLGLTYTLSGLDLEALVGEIEASA